MTRHRSAALAVLASAWLTAGCTAPSSTMHPDAAFLVNDAGLDANDRPIDAGFPLPTIDTCVRPGATLGAPCVSARDCLDGCFCNGAETCAAGTCVAGAMPCADAIACTTDACSEDADRCVHVPDHATCSDHLACNGYERCDATRGCVSVAALVCNDESACTVDSCDDAIGCVFTARDLDGDGFVASTCGGDDCDDYDPAVLPGTLEICDNRRDDDCDGLRDYADDSCHATNDSCAQATFLHLGPTGGTFSGSTVGLTAGYTLACGAPGPDAVFRFTLTEPHDVRITASGIGGIAAAMRPFASCASGPDTRCATGATATFNQRSVPAGTWAVIVRTPRASSFDLRIDLSDPTTPPAIDVCDGSTTDVSAGGTFTGRFEDAHDDYTLGCHATVSTDVAYRFTIAPGHQADLVAAATTMTGTSLGRAFLALTTDCTTAAAEIACVSASADALSRRTLGPGRYYLLLEPADVSAANWSLTVTLVDPPAPRNAGDACSTAFEVTPAGASTTAMASVPIDSLEHDSGTSCGAASGTRDAYFHFALGTPHDVTVTTTTGGSHTAAVSTSCGVPTSELRCRTGGSPVTQTFHSLAAGDYWIAVETGATTGTLTASVALWPPTTPPANDVCASASALTVPLDAHARDTLVGLTDDLRGGACTPTGLVDAFYTFTLPSPMTVSIDATTVPASTHDVWLTLRSTCGPGVDLACGTGNGSAHVSTATALAAGTYYVFVEMREAEAGDFRLQFAAFP